MGFHFYPSPQKSSPLICLHSETNLSFKPWIPFLILPPLALCSALKIHYHRFSEAPGTELDLLWLSSPHSPRCDFYRQSGVPHAWIKDSLSLGWKAWSLSFFQFPILLFLIPSNFCKCLWPSIRIPCKCYTLILYEREDPFEYLYLCRNSKGCLARRRHFCSRCKMGKLRSSWI